MIELAAMVQVALPPVRVTELPPAHEGAAPFDALSTKTAVPVGVPVPGAVGVTFAVMT